MFSFLDVIGLLLTRGQVEIIHCSNDTEKKLLEFFLQDTEGKRLQCTLWGDYTDQFIHLLEQHEQPSNIIIMQFGHATMYKETHFFSNFLVPLCAARPSPLAGLRRVAETVLKMRSCFRGLYLLRSIQRNSSNVSVEEAHCLHSALFGDHPGTGDLYLSLKWVPSASRPFLWGLWPKERSGLDNTEKIILSTTSYTAANFHVKCNLSKERALSSWPSFINPTCIRACNKHMYHEWKTHARAMKLEPPQYTLAAISLSDGVFECLSDFQFNSGVRLQKAAIKTALRKRLEKLKVLGYSVGENVSVKMIYSPSPIKGCSYFHSMKIAFAIQEEDGCLTMRLRDATTCSETENEAPYIMFPTVDSPQIEG